VLFFTKFSLLPIGNGEHFLLDFNKNDLVRNVNF
jgi:hypothetical protein